MTEHQEAVSAAIGRVVVTVFGWLGSITLADVQVVVSTLGGLIVAGYAATQWYVLWRDKIKGK